MIAGATMVFVDWDSARRIGNTGSLGRRKRSQEEEIEEAIVIIEDEISSILSEGRVSRVSWRIYHGWHFGSSPTCDRRSFEKFVASYSSKRKRGASFGRDFVFGDSMFCGSFRSPLRWTVRTSQQTGQLVQKMVDTALTSDLLHAARTKHYDTLIVVGDDDDLLPGIITAESWGSSVYLLRINNNSKLPLLKGCEKAFPMKTIVRGIRS